jgi:Xaa-Pro aminopeptidase
MPLDEQELVLSQREIAALQRAQAIAAEIRERLDATIEDAEGSPLDMVCAQIEHGVTELLEEHTYSPGVITLR